jgi:hypothetical protein
MGARILAIAAAAWTAGYAVMYLLLIRSQDEGSPAWWYVVLLLGATVALLAAGRGRRSRPMAAVGASVLAVATVLAAASIGLFLVPALVAAVAAAVMMRHRRSEMTEVTPR